MASFRTRREIIATLLRSGRPDLANIIARNFADIFGVKNKWVKLKAADLQKDPELADELFELLSIAYKPIGGHAKFTKPADLFDGQLVFQAADIDEDPEADVFKIGKPTPFGLKSTGMGQDGSDKAKKEVVKKSASDLKMRGNYAEMSGAIAHIMLTRFNIESINDPETVKQILKGKKIEWVGSNPNGKYPNNPGWYKRKIGRDSHMKIMLGLPLVKK